MTGKAVAAIAIGLVLGMPTHGRAEGPVKGDDAPPFDLACSGGAHIASRNLAEGGMTVLAFIGLDSKPSREIAVTLGSMVQRHGKQGMRAIAIAADPGDQLEAFASRQNLGFPLCSDAGGKVMASYGAAHVVPISYVIAPDGRIAQVIAGGGMGPQQVMLAVAAKEFARGNLDTADAIFNEVSKIDPKNAEARAGSGFALAKQGKLERAEQEFTGIRELGPDGARMATLGEAEVALARGQLDTAEKKARSAGDAGYAGVIQGQIAWRRGQMDGARKQFEAAAAKASDFPWQSAVAFNDLARVSREDGKPDKTIADYDRAIREEPFLVEAHSNKAVALEKAGRTDEAKKTYVAAKQLAPGNELVTTLLRRLEEHERERNDLERQKMINRLVDELSQTYRSGKPPPKPEDDWSPRSLVVSFVDLQDRLGPIAPDGLSEAFLLSLTQRLQESGRIKVVEREVLEKLLAELKLGSSELADPATRLKLGRVFAASVIGTGGFYPTTPTGQLQLRLIDTETTDIRGTLAEELARPAEVASFAAKVADRIAPTLIAAYPLRGKIASVEGSDIIVGIGKKHGAKAGMRLEVVDVGAPVEVDGEVLGYHQKKIGKLEITSIDDGFSTARALEGGPFAKGQHLTEAKP
jgi:tetratricopeptide (TPR) repeat protein